jgi:CheY-like chemotaxis protein
MVSLLLIGDWDDALPTSVPAFDGPLQVTRARDPDDARRLLAAGACAPPELVLLAEPRRGQFSHASLAALRKQVPLVRVWRMLGSWCEGESRSGRPPAACLTTYWHQWAARFGGEVEIVRRGGNPGWALPLTATADEQILAATDSSFQQSRSGTIAICASSATAAASLVDLCRAAGYDTWIVADDGRIRASGASAVLWDTTVEQMTDTRRVAELRGRLSGAPLVAIVGFPRTEDVESAQRAGIAAVVSKPLLAGDLFWHLDRAACQV